MVRGCGLRPRKVFVFRSAYSELFLLCSFFFFFWSPLFQQPGPVEGLGQSGVELLQASTKSVAWSRVC